MVVAIAAVILTLSLAPMRTLFSGGGVNGAANQVSAALTVARAIALRDGKDAAVFFMVGGDGRVQVRPVEYNSAPTLSPPAWTSGTVYGLGNIVYYTSIASSWVCVIANTASGTNPPGSIDPITNAQDWLSLSNVLVFTDLEDRPPERMPTQTMVRAPIYLGSGSVSWQGPAGALGPTDPNGAQGPLPLSYSQYLLAPGSGNTYAGPGVVILQPANQPLTVSSPATTFLAVWFGSDGATRTSTPAGLSTIAYLPSNGNVQLTMATPVSQLLLYDNRDVIAAGYGDNFGNQNIGGSPNAGPPVPGWLSIAYNPQFLTFNRYNGVLVQYHH